MDNSSRDVCVSLATSNDPDHSPDRITDGNPDTFWMTTGLYPQEFILTFASPTTLSTLSTKTASVRKITIQGSAKDDGSNFETIMEKDLKSQAGRSQNEEFKFDEPHTIKRLKLILDQGYDLFSAVYSVHIT